MRQIVIDGRLAKDAVISVSQNGRQHIKFSIANTIFKGNEEKTEWFDITSFDDFVINKKSKALTKGSYVIVTGNWETEANVSAKDGKLYINQRVVATDVNIPNVGKKSDAAVAPSVSTPEVQVPQVSQPTINIPSVEARLNAAPAPEIVMDKEADDDLPF
jgi:single-stranded DNA-binding protein